MLMQKFAPLTLCSSPLKDRQDFHDNVGGGGGDDDIDDVVSYIIYSSFSLLTQCFHLQSHASSTLLYGR